MTLTQQRQIALGAVRGRIRRDGYEPSTYSFEGAYSVLDNLAQEDRQLVAAQWYLNASDNQFKLLEREWNLFLKRTGK